MLSKKDILKSNDLELECVEIPEWGGHVFVRGLTARERDEFEISIGESLNQDNLRARLVVLGACDEEGERLFNTKDAHALGKKNAAAVDRLFDAIQRLSAMTPDALETIEGN